MKNTYSSLLGALHQSQRCPISFLRSSKFHLSQTLGLSRQSPAKTGPSHHYMNRSPKWKTTVDKIDFRRSSSYEKKFRHDVMAHIHAFGDQCPDAKADHPFRSHLLLCHRQRRSDSAQRSPCSSSFKSSIHVLRLLASFAEKEATSPCLSYTHFQPAQPTTIGKASLPLAARFSPRCPRLGAADPPRSRFSEPKEPPGRKPPFSPSSKADAKSQRARNPHRQRLWLCKDPSHCRANLYAQNRPQYPQCSRIVCSKRP